MRVSREEKKQGRPPLPIAADENFKQRHYTIRIERQNKADQGLGEGEE
jgi:hypothetical protein